MSIKKKTQHMWLAYLFVFALLFTNLTPARAAEITMSRSSATIAIGDTLALQVMNGSSPVTGAVWGSSDPSVASVDQQGVVTGKAKGSAAITAMYNGMTVECLVSVVRQTESQIRRYNVLIIDTSKSMKGTPLKQMKKAAVRFAYTVLKADGKNYVAVINLNNSPQVLCKFTSRYATAKAAINGTTASGLTNMKTAFDKAYDLMKAVPDGDNTIKNVILCSDGLPSRGTKSSGGRYTASDHQYYQFANAVYKVDARMKKDGYFIYGLGFFHNSKGNNLVFGKRLMKDLASKDKYYPITDGNDLDDAFDDIAEQIISLTISDTQLTMSEGEQKTLTVYKNGVKTSASWSSGNTQVASVSQSGVVKAVGAGTTTVRAKVGEKSVSCKVTVIRSTIELDQTDVTIGVGKTVTLKATVTGPSQKVSWRSSDEAVAQVSTSGTVKGVKPGNAVVTATANGVSASCNVTVKGTSSRYIYTVSDLININNNLSGTYTLMNNLNLKGRIWKPIGTNEAPFKGKFNGNGHTIYNLTITGSEDNSGLFGVSEGAVIRNLRVTGKVSGGTYVAGIVGRGIDTTISYCVNKASITGVNQVGGVIGRVYRSKVSYCLNDAPVVGTGRGTGGISADIYPSGSISYCITMKSVTGGNDLTGGIVGGCTDGPVSHCYVAGPVTCKGGRVGAVAGDNSGYAGSRTANFFLKTDSVNATYSAVGSGSGTISSTSDKGLLKLRKKILSKF